LDALQHLILGRQPVHGSPTSANDAGVSMTMKATMGRGDGIISSSCVVLGEHMFSPQPVAHVATHAAG
jgi:hypothetical protein